MLTRVLTGLALAPIVVMVYWAPPWGFLGLATAAGAAVTWEALSLQEARGRRPLRAPAMAGVLLLNLSFFDSEHLPPAAALAAGAAVATGSWFLLRRDVAEALDAMGATVACLVMPGLLMAFQVALRQAPVPDAPGHLLFLYAAVFGHDIGGYFVGRHLGRLPLAPHVSPRKTVEGFLGGVAVGMLLGWAMAAWLLPGLGTGRALLLAGLLAVASALGDLTVSVWKRSAGVKDAGAILPGHGGFLDRLAGLLWATPLYYLVVSRGPAAAAVAVVSCAG